MERRLAANLAADVVGYSRLMGADASGIPGALEAHREDLVVAYRSWQGSGPPK